MNPLYNIGISLYAFAARIASCRMQKADKMLRGQKETIKKIEESLTRLHAPGFDIWVHAASLGEFEQARTLIERVKREQPQTTILLTFFSPSGYEVRKGYDKADCVAYLPFDTPSNAKKFLDAANPKLAIFVKYEFWGNYLQELAKRHIPTYLISAIFRPSQAFFKWYGGIMRGMLSLYKHIYIQDERSRQLLASVGVESTTVAGDTRFDRVTDIMKSTVHFPVISDWISANPAGKVLIAGSSWQPDEACYIPYLNDHPDIKAIIAPHEFDAKRLTDIQAQIKGESVLLSEHEESGIPPQAQVVIIDSFGKLSSLYRYGNAAIIGGGFGAGIHNINEAAVYGMPVIFGPKHQKFKEAADLIACGGGVEYKDAAGLRQALDRLLAPGQEEALSSAGKAAAEYIHKNLGATDKIFSDLFVKK